MQAVQLVAWERPAEVREVPKPVPGPGEVLLRVTGAGLCHSDLHLMHWPAGTVPYELPFTLGHEVAGTVEALGDGADGIDVGESVLVYGPWGCGRCPRCSRGEEHLCERRISGAAPAAASGATAASRSTSCSRPPRLSVPIGDLDPVTAAPLADAGADALPRGQASAPRSAARARPPWSSASAASATSRSSCCAR